MLAKIFLPCVRGRWPEGPEGGSVVARVCITTMEPFLSICRQQSHMVHKHKSQTHLPLAGRSIRRRAQRRGESGGGMSVQRIHMSLAWE